MTILRLVSFADELARFDIDLPPDAIAAIECRRVALEAATTTAVGDLAAGVLDGTVDAKQISKRVKDAATALVVQDKMRAVLRDVEPALDKRARRVAVEHGDALIAQLRVPFDEAAEQLTAAASQFGESPDPLAILSTADAGGVQRWQAGQAALDVLDGVRAARRKLALLGYAGSDPETVSWWLTDLDSTNALDQATAVWKSGRWWALAAAGATFHLNNADETAAVLARAREGSARQRFDEGGERNRISNQRAEADAREIARERDLAREAART